MARIILALFFSINIFACDWSKDVSKMPDGSYKYSKECHIEVGKLVKKVPVLERKIELRDLMIRDYELLADNWRSTSFDLQKRIHVMETTTRVSGWVNFGLGMATTSVAVYLASKLNGAR